MYTSASPTADLSRCRDVHLSGRGKRDSHCATATPALTRVIIFMFENTTVYVECVGWLRAWVYVEVCMCDLENHILFRHNVID